ncbi:hypothetical protein LEMLEM_LOCUS21558, partial [Lemmus lemmus]
CCEALTRPGVFLHSLLPFHSSLLHASCFFSSGLLGDAGVVGGLAETATLQPRLLLPAAGSAFIPILGTSHREVSMKIRGLTVQLLLTWSLLRRPDCPQAH